MSAVSLKSSPESQVDICTRLGLRGLIHGKDASLYKSPEIEGLLREVQETNERWIHLDNKDMETNKSLLSDITGLLERYGPSLWPAPDPTKPNDRYWQFAGTSIVFPEHRDRVEADFVKLLRIKCMRYQTNHENDHGTSTSQRKPKRKSSGKSASKPKRTKSDDMEYTSHPSRDSRKRGHFYQSVPIAGPSKRANRARAGSVEDSPANAPLRDERQPVIGSESLPRDPMPPAARQPQQVSGANESEMREAHAGPVEPADNRSHGMGQRTSVHERTPAIGRSTAVDSAAPANETSRPVDIVDVEFVKEQRAPISRAGHENLSVNPLSATYRSGSSRGNTSYTTRRDRPTPSDPDPQEDIPYEERLQARLARTSLFVRSYDDRMSLFPAALSDCITSKQADDALQEYIKLCSGGLNNDLDQGEETAEVKTISLVGTQLIMGPLRPEEHKLFNFQSLPLNVIFDEAWWAICKSLLEVNTDEVRKIQMVMTLH
ncbi:hypothetical protein AAFC00_005971 [Neodothiora populina]|uniref:Uncharacterized protein n=1 Tax=Neodothiora populina TaxID=2781224 RepID=A0ABR3P6I7_9PEZI